MVRKILLLFAMLLLASSSTLSAQELVVKKISEKTSDLTARIRPRKDLNGELCAAVIVAAPALDGIVFSGNIVGEVHQEAGTYEFYVPAGTKRISFKHENFLPGTIDFEKSGLRVEQSTTYLVILQKPDDQAVQSQFLVFNLNPKDALVELDGEMLSVNNGVAMKLVRLGTYEYKVYAAGYKPTEDYVNVTDPKVKTVVDVTLNASVGKIVVGRSDNSSIEGATVFLDGKLLSDKAPLSLEDIPAGRHTIRVMKQMYASVEREVTVSEGHTIIYNPLLKSNAARVRVTAPAGTTIRVNAEEKGSSLWVGSLTSGLNLFEALRNGEVVCSESLELMPSEEEQVVELKEKAGSMVITTSVIDARVFVDGEEVGSTPLFLDEVAPGQHSLRISLDGYKDENRVVYVDSGQRTTVEVDMIQGSGASDEVPSAPELAASDNLEETWHMVSEEIIKLINDSVRDNTAYASTSQVQTLLNVAYNSILRATSSSELAFPKSLIAAVANYDNTFRNYGVKINLNKISDILSIRESELLRSEKAILRKEKVLTEKEEYEKRKAETREMLDQKAKDEPGSLLAAAVSIRNNISSLLAGEDVDVTNKDVKSLVNILHSLLNSVASLEQAEYFNEMITLADYYNTNVNYSSELDDLIISLRRDYRYLIKKL